MKLGQGTASVSARDMRREIKQRAYMNDLERPAGRVPQQIKMLN